ncbi:alaserpin isoform X1 [Andrena cerasifolii]|uniref:alaserpin isoform X1 n=2 Tax=Andrena cerasifolii TaxID=2819439 RepID=UPI004038036D
MAITMFKSFIGLITIFFATMAQSTNTPSNSRKDVHKNLSTSCNEFTKDFNKELALASKGNIVSSPLSVHMILSLLSHGADSETLDELTTGLYHLDKNSIEEGYTSLIAVLNELKDVKLYIANALYVQGGLELLTEFLTIGTDVYQSMISKLDFKRNVDASEKINKWVKETTNNKISDLVTSDDFDEYTKLVLINAIYFNGIWLHKFDTKNTEKRAFHVTETEKKFVPTMFNKSKYNHGEIPSLKAKFIEIPYMNKDIVMTIILPNEANGLSTVQNNFSWEILANTPRSANEVELYLPKFKIEFTVDLKSILRKLGLSKMFDDNAEFNRMTKVPLKVSKVLHKAVIDVNEEGTEAAAATAVHMRLRRMINMPVQFLVDRPFMFVIEYKPNNIPLFVGSVRDINVTPKKDEL